MIIPVIPFEADLPKEPDYWENGDMSLFGAHGIVMPPGETLTLPIDLEDGEWTQEFNDMISNQEGFLCAYGFVSYEDIFGRAHETRFCLAYPAISRLTVNPDGRFSKGPKYSIGGPQGYNQHT
jgi:hypothetical protein